MLDLEICRKCCAADEIKAWDVNVENVKKNCITRNYVACPGGDGLRGYLDKLPPEWCHFKFEQSIAAGMTND